MSGNRKIAYIPNAGDYTQIDWEKRGRWNEQDIQSLREIGLEVEYLDLKDYFEKTEALREKIDQLGGVFFRGGNTFILRQAMKLSGFDHIFEELKNRDDFVYAGYSAGICVLAPDFRALQIVDEPNQHPYPEQEETIWEGLGYLDYIILPHYKSDHPESADIDKEVEFAQKNKIPFRTLKDGEVIILEWISSPSIILSGKRFKKI